MMDELPHAIAESTMEIFGVTLHCHVLNTGERIIDAEDLRALLRAMAGDCSDLDEAEISRFYAFMRGQTP